MRAGEQQRILDGFVEAMKAASGVNLLSVVLYGSAAGTEFSEKYSDLNLLVLFRSLEAKELAKAAPVLRWWAERGQPGALVFTREELERSADVFAIELLDIQRQHRILFGEDAVREIEVPLKFHRLQVERELRLAVVRLRQRYPEAERSRKLLLEMLVESASTFQTLLRHALIAMGEPVVSSREAVLERVQAVFKVDVSALRTLTELREGKVAERDLDVKANFASYLNAMEALVEQVDLRLPR